MATKLNDLVRTPDGEVTTISELDKQGRIEYHMSDNFYTRRGGPFTKYFADMAGTKDGWEISKVAYLSRTGQEVKL